MVSLNLPPAPLRKGNNQALDLHHSIGLSATPSSLCPGRELRKYHYLEVPEAAYSSFKVRPAAAPAPFRSWAAAVTIVYRTFEQKFMDS